MLLRTTALAAALSLAPALLHAQFNFRLAGRDFQVHSFASQSYVDTGNNNYLTMKTSQGSFAMTDGGVNLSTQLTDKLRVGAQVYVRNVGSLGNWHPTLDWASVDYKFKDWFGVRAGKVKSALGLYNDTQDMGFLHTWAILPQSLYPIDLRASTLAHTGVDVYGTFGLKRLGSIAYTAYVGARSKDPYGGYQYGLKSLNIDVNITGRNTGGDLRYNTPIPGLVVGSSLLFQPMHGVGRRDGTIPYDHQSKKFNTTSFYAQFTKGNFRADWEHQRTWHVENIALGAARYFVNEDHRGWYLSGAYRICRKIEVGSYYSRYGVDVRYDGRPVAPWHDHLFDKAVTARVDLTNYWHVKVEGHFMDGVTHPPVLRGFYPQQNPGGFQPTTNLLIVRTGWNF